MKVVMSTMISVSGPMISAVRAMIYQWWVQYISDEYNDIISDACNDISDEYNDIND